MLVFKKLKKIEKELMMMKSIAATKTSTIPSIH
jgi:hypothetical protein